MAYAGPMKLIRPSVTEWLCLVAGIYLTVHYAWLIDDAFVYFRYIDNLLFLNIGLVHNQGEYVEGFSSPLWTLLLIAGRSLGSNWWLLVRVLGVASFVGFWMLLVASHRRLATRSHLNVPLILLTFNYGVLSSFTSGLETPLVQLAAAAFTWNTLNPRSRLGQVLVGLTPLARHELFLPWLISVAWSRRRLGRWPWWSLAIALGTLTGWTLFRIVYYADILPNTFHLKNTTWIGQGLRYVWDSVSTYGLFVVLPVAGAGAWILRRKGRELPEIGSRWIMIALALAVMAYVVKIGGDFLHYRFLAFSIPLLVIPVAGIVESAMAGIPARTARWVLPTLGIALAIAVSFLYPHRLDRHPYTLQARYYGDGIIEDAMSHRLRPELARKPMETGAAFDKRAEYREHVRPYSFSALVADYWCVRNYDHFDWYVVHSLGLTDPVLARIDVPSDRPGHRWHLHPLGRQLVDLRAKYGFGPGLYRKAIRGGDAPDWIEANLDRLELIDRRAYNSHDFFENLGLALRRPGRLKLVSPPPKIPTIRGRKLGQ
jgi:hypothetical protein